MKLKACVALGVAAIGLSASGEVYFEEDFTNYGDTAPGVVEKEGIRVGNDPVWNCCADLSVRPMSDFDLYEKPIRLAADGKFDLSFDFRLLTGTTNNPCGFQLVLGNGTKTWSLPVNVAAIGGFRQDPILPLETWRGLLVKSTGESGDVYLATDRRFTRLGSVNYGFVPTEFNFGVSSNGAFGVTKIRACTPEAVPAFSASRHFASFKSLCQPIEGAKGFASPVTIDVADGQCGGVLFQANGLKELGHADVTFADGTTATFPLKVVPQKQELRANLFGKKKGETVELADSALEICGVRQYVRPNLQMFQSLFDIVPQGVDVMRDWESLPSASRHAFQVMFVRTGGVLQLWIDGSFVATLAKKQPPRKGEPAKPALAATKVVLSFADGVTGCVRPNAPFVDPFFMTLDFSACPRAKTFVDGELVGIKSGDAKIAGYPMSVARPIDSADVAICHQAMGNWALEVEEYHGRSPLDGFPSGIHYRLPAAPYCRAGILFALDDDPAKDRVLTLRLGHYVPNGSGGNMSAAVSLDCSNGIPDACREVGAVRVGDKTAKLYFADIALDVGKIIDLTTTKDYLDFDVCGKLWENFQQLDNSMKPDPKSTSAFNLFGVTLRKAEFSFEQKQSQPGNVFTEDETDRSTAIVLKALVKGAKGTLDWVARDTDGKKVFDGRTAFDLAKAGDKKTVKIDFGSKTPRGIYTLEIGVSDGTGTRVLTHPATFAILPERKRNWEMFKSPYAMWWFDLHGSPGDADVGFPILTKAGIRKASWREPTKAEQEKWGVTRCGNVECFSRWGGVKFFAKTRQFEPLTVKGKSPDGKPVEKVISGEDRFVGDLKGKIAKSTWVDHVMIWHESGPKSGIPEELLDLPVPEPGHANKAESLYMIECSRIIRKHFPGLRIQMGNFSAAMGAAVWPLRLGAAPDSFDCLGMETPAQVVPTERLSEVGILGMLVSQDAASRLAKRKVPLNGAWEFTYRADRDMGEELQAEWHTRDTIVCLAHDFKLISPGILFDCCNGYYNGLWGGAGLLRRSPYVYPKRAYVAYAVLTKVLDDVTFEKALPTGSGTAYAYQFRRADGRWITALWFQRGEGEMEVDSVGGMQTEMYGRETELVKGRTNVRVSGAPVYLTTERPLSGVRIVARAFKQDGTVAAHAKVASPMDKEELFSELSPDPQVESRHHEYFPYLKPSAFSMKVVEDGEKGRCVEVSLDPRNERKYTEYTTEYTTLRFKEPVAIDGEPEMIGVWVKGNSNGGQLRFEIEDADGEVFKNLSTGQDWACDIMDWPGNLAVNFDGWSFVYQTLKQTKLIPTHSPGAYKEQWVSCGGDKKIRFPIKVRAITVGVYRHLFTPLGFDRSSQITEGLRLKNLSGICSSGQQERIMVGK